jgi:hypothetical protein
VSSKAGSSPLADPQLLTNERRDLGASEQILERFFGKPAGPIPEKPALVNKMYFMACFYQSEHRLEYANDQPWVQSRKSSLTGEAVSNDGKQCGQ